jgi:ribosomal protein S14
MRGRLENHRSDPYYQQTLKQALGHACEYCGSHSGHYGKCALLNGSPEKLREVAVTKALIDSVGDVYQELTRDAFQKSIDECERIWRLS